MDEQLARAFIFGGLALGWIAEEHGWLGRLRCALRARQRSAWNRRGNVLAPPDKACNREVPQQ